MLAQDCIAEQRIGLFPEEGPLANLGQGNHPGRKVIHPVRRPFSGEGLRRLRGHQAVLQRALKSFLVTVSVEINVVSAVLMISVFAARSGLILIILKPPRKGDLGLYRVVESLVSRPALTTPPFSQIRIPTVIDASLVSTGQLIALLGWW